MAPRDPKIPLSPLRYPGGKRKLAPLIHHLITVGKKDIKLFVEPFVGGGAIAVTFLENYKDTVIALADADPLVANFWRVTFSDEASKLADKVATSKPSITLWKRVKNSKPDKPLDLAFKCLFLNRTSFSGIIHDEAGPIGGFDQKSAYKIDCRFNNESLAKRLIELSHYRDRVYFVRCQSWKKTLSDILRSNFTRQHPAHVFWYLDPPFFQKAKKLYRHTFSDKDHQNLKESLDRFPGNFVLSYDDVAEARTLYEYDEGFVRVDLSYNARIDRVERSASSEILVSNIIRDLRTESEKKTDKDIPFSTNVLIQNQAGRSLAFG